MAIRITRRKTKGLIWGVCGLLFLCFAALIIASCADDSTYEARLEEARMAIDDRDYRTAIDLLEKLKADYPGDPLILQYLSNAYAGLTGLDTFNLLTVIDQLIDGDPGSIDIVGTVLGDGTGIFYQEDIDNALYDLNLAIAALEEIGTENLTDDQKVQLGLLSLNRAAMTIADIVLDNTDEDYVTLTEDGLHGTYGGTAPDLSNEATADRLDSLSEDMQNIGGAVSSIGSLADEEQENDLSESFNDFQSNLDTNGDGSITREELQNYLGSL